METIHIGLAIKRLADRKKVSAEDVAENLKIDRQSVYGTYKRSNVSPKTIEKYAGAIGVTVEDVMQEAGISKSKDLISNTPNYSNDNYLMRRLADLEEMVQFLKGQVSEKDKQISVLLGKSDSVFSAGYGVIVCFFGLIGLIFGYTALN